MLPILSGLRVIALEQYGADRTARCNWPIWAEIIKIKNPTRWRRYGAIGGPGDSMRAAGAT
jgi:hypothetical protein